MKQTDFEKIKTVVWDYNGTVLDDIDISVRSINTMLGLRGLPLLTREEYRDTFCFPVKTYYEKIGFDFTAEEWAFVGSEFISLYNSVHSESGVFPGAKDLLGIFTGLGINQFLLSAMEHGMLTRSAAEKGISQYFTEMSGIDNIYAVSKLEKGKSLFHRHRLNPRETLFIGDTDHDWEVAGALGCRCILISCGHQSPSCLKGAGCTAVFASHSEILERMDVSADLRRDKN